jgi:uncharacterized protein (TIGR03437 family)
LTIARFALTATITSFLAFPLYLISENGGAEPGRTGGPFPGERSCGDGSQCHNTTPNTGPGSVTITANGAPIDQYRYTPSETIELIIRVADPERGRWGFQVTARNSSNGCQSEGSFASVDDETSVRTGTALPCMNFQYVTHAFPEVGAPGHEFALRWTAPASNVGPIVFAAAGNAANGNNLSSGDRIYTTSTVVQPSAPAPPPPTPSISAGGVVLATLAPIVATAAPSAIVSIFGQEFAAAGTQALTPSLDGNGRVSTELAGVCVEIGGHRSPMFAVLPTQLNLQASHQVGLGPQAVTVIRACGQPNEVRSAPEMVNFAAAAPGFFVFTNFGGQNGANPIAALHGGGPHVVAPAGLFQDNAQQTFFPAAAGEFVSLFATGLGAVGRGMDTVVAGEIPNRAVPINGALTLRIGGVPLDPNVDVTYAGVAPCCAGLYQIVARVPTSLGAGQHEVVMTVDGVASPPGPFIPVQ